MTNQNKNPKVDGRVRKLPQTGDYSINGEDIVKFDTKGTLPPGKKINESKNSDVTKNNK